ncbi:arrestin domain-containing protein 3-like [Brachionichthys hirsutus]|uniref:arrestin domain-containing protein 3-like n=1 Tax=Brachionichthys hirsutus TaxID=412623 RepID=UPI0036054795
MTIRNFLIEYDAINNGNTFTNGDTINGRITVELSKETKLTSIVFTGQGRAEVCWSEHYGEYQHYVYRAAEKYYHVTYFILKGERPDEAVVLGQGRHVFPFSFKIPDRKMPSSFKNSTARIVHKLTADLNQPMRLTKTAKAHFAFVSKADLDIPGLLNPQYGCKNKPVKVFGSGAVSLNVSMSQMGCEQGQDMVVMLDISNQSTRSVKPKLIMYEKKSYFAQGKRKVCIKELHKESSVTVPSSSEEAVPKAITIPRDVTPSILNCAIFKLEYMVKVSLDVKWAANPEIKLPIVILPASAERGSPDAAGFDLEVFNNSNQRPRAMMSQQAAPQPLDPPPAYEAHEKYPTFHGAG